MVKSGQINQKRDDEGYGAVRAIDPNTGGRKWEFRMADVTDSGILTTGTNLLFVGGREGYFFALDANNGSMLWKANTGGQISSGPMTYAAGGKQYVAVAAGNALYVYALRDSR
jgi:alcohol dehydrogenase (cytochrome c)